MNDLIINKMFLQIYHKFVEDGIFKEYRLYKSTKKGDRIVIGVNLKDILNILYVKYKVDKTLLTPNTRHNIYNNFKTGILKSLIKQDDVKDNVKEKSKENLDKALYIVFKKGISKHLVKKSKLKEKLNNELLSTALKVIDIETAAMIQLKSSIDSSFIEIIEILNRCTGKIIISGIGKSAIVSQKIISTLNSIGVQAQFLHAVDALHGDLGMIRPADIIIIISKSGESPEIKNLINVLNTMPNILIGIVGNLNSYLKKNVHFFINATIKQEACINNLAPTTSTTIQMLIGDIIAVSLMHLKKIDKNTFAKLHPGGNIGQNLQIRIEQVVSKENKPCVNTTTPIYEVIHNISAHRLGATVVLDEKNNTILGIITDGDIRRMLEKFKNIKEIYASDIYSSNFKAIESDMLATEALQILKQENINQLIVLKNREYFGMIHIHDLINQGIL